MAFFGLHVDNLPEGNDCVLDMTKWMDCEKLVPWIFTWKSLRKENWVVDITTSISALCIDPEYILWYFFIIDDIVERYFLFN